MAKKQATNKTSGKGKLVDAKASTQGTTRKASKALAPFNGEAQKFWDRDFLTERGFKLSNASPSFMSTVTNLRRETFISHKNSYYLQVVREFYAGIPDNEEGKPLTYSMVRKIRVHFDPKVINDEYHLGYTGPNFENMSKTYGRKEIEQVNSRIALKNVVWEKVTPH